jgi:hypothetical protein
MDSKAPRMSCGLPSSISPNSSILGQITYVLDYIHTRGVFMSSCELVLIG